MAFGLDDLDEEELAQFKEHKKVRVFFQGINALLVSLTLIIGTVEVAENLESQYQMDFEAILSDARSLKMNLMGLNDQLNSLLDLEAEKFLCEDIDLLYDGIINQEGFEQSDQFTIETVLKAAHDKASNDIQC